MPASRPRACQRSKDFWRTLPAPPVTSGALAVIGCPTFLQLFRGRRQRRRTASCHPRGWLPILPMHGPSWLMNSIQRLPASLTPFDVALAVLLRDLVAVAPVELPLSQALGCIAAEMPPASAYPPHRSEEHTSELQSLTNLVCRLLLE